MPASTLLIGAEVHGRSEDIMPAVLPYTTGLTGVDLTMDNVSTRALYLTVGSFCVIILLVRLVQQGSGYLRMITTLSAPPERQTFWKHESTAWWPIIKKKFLYAPLKHVRHNRELQLSSAVNVGTIPGRLHTLLLMLYFLSNVVYICVLDYNNPNKAALVAELRGRAGHLSVLNMIALFIMAGRNNPFIRILRVSFDTFNLFHRWIGRIVILQAAIHTLAWGVNKQLASGLSGIGEALATNNFLKFGTLAMASMLLILFQSPSVVRHAFYETFLHLHQLLAFLALLGIFMHAKIDSLPQFPFVIFIIFIWFGDRLARILRIFYRNVSFSRGITRVTVEALPGEACRVSFHLPRPWKPSPGTHVYAYLPTLSFWQSHPFSVAWTDTTIRPNAEPKFTDAPPNSPDIEKARPKPLRIASTVSLIMSARTGMTRSLFKRASLAPLNKIEMYGLLEGPYGSLESLHSYGTVLLFAGGVGITHQLGHIRDLLAHYDEGTIPIQKITLVWTVRTTDLLEWVRPWMDELLAMPGRREILKVMIYVTRPKVPTEVRNASERVLMFGGRPQAKAIVEEEFQERVGAMSIGVCGPGAFADDVRAAARAVVDRGKVDFWEEGFTW